jgi:hypothetical protein
MKMIGCDISEFMRRTKDKEIVCWGAGYWLRHLSDTFDTGIENCFSYIVDSNQELWGTKVIVGKKELEIHPPQHIYDTVSDRTALLITFYSCLTLLEKLSLDPKFDNIECYSSCVLSRYEDDKILYSVPPVPDGYRINEAPQIPKMLHYLWFCGEPLPDKFKQYLESWHKFCPDYEIIEWNQNNYDLSAHPYMRDAAALGRYAFASDYARLDIIYKHGGIYFDLDVELIRNIDELRYYSAFCGFMTTRLINPGGGFGARSNHPMIKLLRDEYDSISFFDTQKPDSNWKYMTSPEIQTSVMEKHGLKLNGEFQIIRDIAILPAVYFNPFSAFTNRYLDNEHTFSIHHYASSWLDKDELNTLLNNHRYPFHKFRAIQKS